MATLHEQIIATKRAAIAKALDDAHGCRASAARALGTNRTYVARLIRQLGIEAQPSPSARTRRALRRAAEAG